MDGHIKLFRKFLDWGWYQDINTKVLFIHMLLKANWKDGKFMGTTVPRGSFVSSIRNLAYETGLTEREVRTGISHLKTTGEVTRYKYHKFTVFAINNYDKYQLVTGKATEWRQGDDKVATGQRQQNKKIEEDKEDIYLSILDAESQNFPPTLEEIRLFAEQEKIRIDVQKFYDYYTERDWKTKNGNFIRNWKKTLQYWGETEGTPHKGKKQQQETPVSENAEAYASLILNLDEPI